MSGAAPRWRRWSIWPRSKNPQRHHDHGHRPAHGVDAGRAVPAFPEQGRHPAGGDDLGGRAPAAAPGPAGQAASPTAALQAVFMAHIGFVSERPGVPRLIFGELQRPGQTVAKRMVQTLIQQYGERLRRLLEAGKPRASWTRRWTCRPPPCSSWHGAGAGDAVAAGRRRGAHAPGRAGVFAIYLRGIRRQP